MHFHGVLFCKNVPDFQKLNNDLRKLGFDNINSGKYIEDENIKTQIDNILKFVDDHVTCMNTLNINKN